MPLSTFFKSSRFSQQFGRKEKDMLVLSPAMETERPKRSLLRRLLGKSDYNTDVQSTNQSQKTAKLKKLPSSDRKAQSSIVRAEQPQSAMPDPNKPLPPPPPSDIPVVEMVSKPSVKLDRIISALGTDDLQRLFAGAPQFVARKEGEELPSPSIVFPFDVHTHTRSLIDYVTIDDEAWVCASAQASRAAVKTHNSSKGNQFLPQCWERPGISSMQGLEKGSMGFQAALEIGIADALQNPDDMYNTEEVSKHRWKALNSKQGLRSLTDAALIERLLHVSDVYHQTSEDYEIPIVQLYTELFTHMLHPPSRVVDVDDPYSLLVQVDALISVLSIEHIWFDFSKVEWRIRLGQILWASSNQDEEDVVEVNGENMQEATTQKYWLLFQILLSCELLLRLDMVVAKVPVNKDVTNPGEIPGEIQQYEKSVTPSLQWTLILARQWFENIQVQKPTKELINDKANSGWLASLTGTSHPKTEPLSKTSINELRFEGRHQARQAKGLVHFARNLHWPNTDAILTKVAANGITVSDLESAGNTPLATPRSTSTQRSSYFSKRPGMRRGLSSINDRLSAIINPSGWLSNSYISGLILPGESLSHFLISTLLENDSEAVSKLGEETNLYGGFIYGSKGFWSVSCIVGRVLAGGKGSRECMGWISSNVVPKGVREQWVDIDVETVEDLYLDKKERRPRILRKTTIEQRGHIIARADESSVLPGDFTSPCDRPIDALSVQLQSLDFFAIDETTPPTPVEENGTPDLNLPREGQDHRLRTYSAMIRFSISTSNEVIKEVNLSLQNDVYFLSAHPCAPPDVRKPTSGSFSSDYKDVSGHPLYKAFTYTKISLSHLLTTPISATFSSLLLPASSPTASHYSSKHTTSSGIPKVLVIDCTDADAETHVVAESRSAVGSDLEILGRATCSERGWNALISRRGKSCLSCAIREAGAVGWRVILRVG